MSEPSQPVLSFDAVSAAADGGAFLKDASLRVQPGERIFLQAGEELRPLIADLAGGLAEPDAGEVSFEGECWIRLDPSAQSRRRRRIGWIFPEPAWLYNLDVDENVTLSERFHGDRSLADVDAEAEALARTFGLPGLPRLRPAWASARERLASQWVRALLGSPSLLIVDSGAEHADDPDFEPLWNVVDQRHAAGLAVLWMAHRNPGASRVGGFPALRYVVDQGTLRQIP